MPVPRIHLGYVVLIDWLVKRVAFLRASLAACGGICFSSFPGAVGYGCMSYLLDEFRR